MSFATQERKQRHKGERKAHVLRAALESRFLFLLPVLFLLGKPCELTTILPKTLARFLSLPSISLHLNMPLKVQEVARETEELTKGHIGS